MRGERIFQRILGLLVMNEDTTYSVSPLLTPSELATILQVPVKTLTAWRYHGTGPVWVRVGRYIRYRPSDVQSWLDSQVLREVA